VVSGPSGAGKDTVLNRIRERGTDASFIVTVTTRPRRDYEIDGVNYHFVSQQQFNDLKENGDLLEFARVYGNWYGVPRDQVIQAVEKGRDAIIKVDIQGALTIKKNMPEACFIFVTPPEVDQLPSRLRKRNTESADELELRLKTAGSELEGLQAFDYVVLNYEGEIDRAADDILAIIKAEKLKTSRANIRPGPAR
jgi:guanylate kinase